MHIGVSRGAAGGMPPIALLAVKGGLKSPPLLCAGAGGVPTGDLTALAPGSQPSSLRLPVSHFLTTSPASSSSSLYIHEVVGTGINKS